ncbi:hypothetical protein [Vagococcus sp. WN89Y]|uniref:hypothetical protein n=1 Tax=Vagococcus sp. WN89Y TaxID=3457258 RepID=UPI003FCEC377
MNFVYFKVDNLPHDKTNHGSFTLRGVELLRDGEVIAAPGDINVTELPYFYFCVVPTGFRKIEFRLQNSVPPRVQCSAGYLKSGDYLVDTPDGELVLPFNALNGSWTLDVGTRTVFDNRTFMERNFTLIRPVKSIHRHISAY